MLNKILTSLILLPIFILPRSVKRLVAYLFTGFWYYLAPHRKTTMIQNIQRAFPNYTKQEVNKVAFRSFYNWALTFLEYSYFPFISQRRLGQILEFQGEGNLKQAFAKNKGVLVLGTHTGNGEIGIYDTCKKGYPLSLIGRKVKNKFLNEALFYIREKSGLKHLEPKNSSIKVVRALKNNEAVLFVIDQFTYPPIGIKSQFFGHTTGTNSSLAYFALKLGAPVIPAYSYRKKGKIIVVFDKEIESERPYQDLDENLSYLTQKYNGWIEEIIRQHPESWMWIHNRWKKYF